MPVIHIGEGKHIEIEEGALHKPPPPPKKRKIPKKYEELRRTQMRGPATKTKVAGDNHWFRRRIKEIPGYQEWLSIRTTEMLVGIRKPRGWKPGQAKGLLKEEAEEAWKIAKEKAEIHMANIKKVINVEDERAEKAMLATLEILESPMNQQLRLAAARQILEWTRAKPAAKSEVTVNAAEAWLASIAEDTKDGDKD